MELPCCHFPFHSLQNPTLEPEGIIGFPRYWVSSSYKLNIGDLFKFLGADLVPPEIYYEVLAAHRGIRRGLTSPDVSLKFSLRIRPRYTDWKRDSLINILGEHGSLEKLIILIVTHSPPKKSNQWENKLKIRNLMKTDSRILHSRGQPPIKRNVNNSSGSNFKREIFSSFSYAFFISNIKKCNMLIANNTQNKIH